CQVISRFPYFGSKLAINHSGQFNYRRIGGCWGNRSFFHLLPNFRLGKEMVEFFELTQSPSERRGPAAMRHSHPAMDDERTLNSLMRQFAVEVKPGSVGFISDCDIGPIGNRRGKDQGWSVVTIGM